MTQERVIGSLRNSMLSLGKQRGARMVNRESSAIISNPQILPLRAAQRTQDLSVISPSKPQAGAGSLLPILEPDGQPAALHEQLPPLHRDRPLGLAWIGLF